MSKPASKTLIGVFVVGAVALAVLAVIVFGSGKLFTRSTRYVMYFEGSVKGLAIGSPVMFRGVKVGEVRDIGISFNADDLSFVIPVIIEVHTEKVQKKGKDRVQSQDHYLTAMIEHGLRAQLQILSVVTASLMIAIDMVPDKPARFYSLDDRYLEIPTIPSTIDEFLRTAQEIPLKELFDKLLAAIEGIDRAVNSDDLAESMRSLNEGLADAKEILASIRTQADPVLADLKQATSSLKTLLANSEQVPGKISEALTVAVRTLNQAETVLTSFADVASDKSPIYKQVNDTLEQLSKAARSLRTLSDFLDRHPEALLWGKEPYKGVKE
jgi:paraquat-inducible protein B